MGFSVVSDFITRETVLMRKVFSHLLKTNSTSNQVLNLALKC